MKRCSLGGRVGPAVSSLAPAGHTHPLESFVPHSRMALLPRSGELASVSNLQELIALVGVPGAVWTAFTGQVGGPGTNLQHLASLPDFIVAQACS